MAAGDTEKTNQQANTARRDLLLQLQEEAQRRWSAEKVFEVDAPEEDGASQDLKWTGNFPYPYMNGLLHLGHAFSLSKLEFAAAFHRVCGRHVLFPQGFHCTGMPIKACADKLKREIAQFGDPPVFPEDLQEEEAKSDEGNTNGGAEAKHKGKKSKLVAKTGKLNYQWQIMRSLGVPEGEISAFQEAEHWLRYFPPKALDDIAALGCGVDWRRSFITTDVNPYYDSFVSWHMNTLRKKGKIVKDKRYTIYSPLDGQPCADHDRATGEGVGPQEYTLIKMKAIELPGKLQQLAGRDVFFLAATLRPETMYGQTNCWILPDGDYGAYKAFENDVYVMSARSALNLAFQERLPKYGAPEQLLSLKGYDLLGVPLKAPNAIHERIYTLPMLTILTNKGTGVVTSVPSDSPDDFMALCDLKKKEKFREKYGVKDEWVLPFDVIPIINIPEFGDTSAPSVCAELKIQSQNDTAKLAEAKNRTYLKGFTDGTMLVGEYAGQKVQVAKPLIREAMLASSEAVAYSEPEKPVMSRSGDDCIVALTDQWYLLYGEEDWLEKAKQCLDQMELYSEDARRAFEHTLGWLKQWACSRSYGLGTRLPWDQEFLVESLSDSTIYMAYYTVAHILQGGDIYGEGKSLVTPDQLSEEVWNYIFLGGPQPQDSTIDKALLETCRREFRYWYPFDLRVSGKDLIQNHLTFCIYNHVAMWDSNPDMWPRSFRCNGHLQLNSEKMSKSTGNFKTLREAIEEYSADAVRIALADAGDSMDDANMVEATANAAILRLTKELTWSEEVMAAPLRQGEASLFADRVFDNELNYAVKSTYAAYENLMFREALKTGWFELLLARDTYRLACGTEGMHRDLVQRFVEVSAVLLAPIAPHASEHVWQRILNKEGTVLKAGWPAANEPDLLLQKAARYLEDQIVSLRKLIMKFEASAKKKCKGGSAPKVVGVDLFVAAEFQGWKAHILRLLASKFVEIDASFADDTDQVALGEVAKLAESEGLPAKKMQQQVMPFVKFKKEEATKAKSSIVLDLQLPFDERATLLDNAEYVKRSLNLESFHVFLSTDEKEREAVEKECNVLGASPGVPAVHFKTVQ